LFSLISALMNEADRPSPPRVPITFLPQSVDMWSRENDAPAGAPPISVTVPRMPTESAACRSTETLPVHSRLKSAGPPQISWVAATGSAPGDDTSIVSVAPSSRARDRRDASRSTAMISVAPVSRAAITAESPTAPAP
jgi:hypothetical protein